VSLRGEILEQRRGRRLAADREWIFFVLSSSSTTEGIPRFIFEDPSRKMAVILRLIDSDAVLT
jgi:hypothetical protein